MILIGHTQCRTAVAILQLRVERNTIALARQRSTAAEYGQTAGKTLGKRALELGTPGRRVGRQTVQRVENRCRRQKRTRVDDATAVEAAFRIRLIKILNDARALDALVLVQIVLEHRIRTGMAV